MELIARLLRRIRDFLVLFFSHGRVRRPQIVGPMAELTDSVVMADPNEPYMLKPLFLTEIAFPDSDTDDDGEEQPWQPCPRSGHRIVCIGNHSVYSFGGYNPERGGDEQTLFGELWKFDLLNYRWTLLLGPDAPGMPKELASMTMCASGNYILIYGGSGLPFGHQNSNRLHVCDTTQNPPTLREIQTTGEKPPELYGQSMVLREQYLYVVGGTSGYDYACDLHRLDLGTCVWECIGRSRPFERGNDPEGRYRHELAADDEHILVFGGGTTTETFPLDVLPAFHLPTGKWIKYETHPDKGNLYPLPRKFHALVQCQGQVFVCGGCNSNVVLRDIWRLDLATRTWTKLELKLPYRLFFHDAAITQDGCMFIFGGVRDRTVATRTNNLYKLWLRVPPLTAIVAEAVRYWLRINGEDEGGENLIGSGSVAANFRSLPSHCRSILL